MDFPRPFVSLLEFTKHNSVEWLVVLFMLSNLITLFTVYNHSPTAHDNIGGCSDEKVQT